MNRFYYLAPAKQVAEAKRIISDLLKVENALTICLDGARDVEGQCG
jgi:hypothetical protein